MNLFVSCSFILVAKVLFAVGWRSDSNVALQSDCPTTCSCNYDGIQRKLDIICSSNGKNVEFDYQLKSYLLPYYGAQVKIIRILNSPLDQILPVICDMTDVNTLDLTGNRIEQIPDGKLCSGKLDDLVEFTAANNRLTSLQNGVFDGMTNLQKVNLSGNEIETIGDKVFSSYSKLNGLRVVDLSFNNVTYGIDLAEMPPVIDVTRTSSKMQFVADSWLIQLLQQVDTVYLNGNQIGLLPEDVQSIIVKTTHLDLANNTWNCSCSNWWFKKWTDGHESILVNPSGIYCYFPASLYGEPLLNRNHDEFCPPTPPTLPTTTTSKHRPEPVVVIVVVPSVFVPAAVFLVLTLLIVRFRIFRRDECVGEQMFNDIFLCCSSVDHQLHGTVLLDLLKTRRFRVFYWDISPLERRQLGCERIAIDRFEQLKKSKRSVFLVTRHFLQSFSCVAEFNYAYRFHDENGRLNRIVVLLSSDCSQPPQLTSCNFEINGEQLQLRLLHQFLKRRDFITYDSNGNDSVWLDKLIKRLPVEKMNSETAPLLNRPRVAADV